MGFFHTSLVSEGLRVLGSGCLGVWVSGLVVFYVRETYRASPASRGEIGPCADPETTQALSHLVPFVFAQIAKERQPRVPRPGA